MKNLPKKTQEEIAELQKLYVTRKAALDEAVTVANREIEIQISKVNDRVTDLNAVIEEMNDLRESVADDIGSFIDDKSDAWRDGERGSTYSEWKDAWSEEIGDIEDVPSHEIEIEFNGDGDNDEPLNDSAYPRESGL